MDEPATTRVTIPLYCRHCDRQFLLPLDDFEHLLRCYFCGATDVAWHKQALAALLANRPAATNAALERMTREPASDAAQDRALLDSLLENLPAGGGD